jgi:hypothetical protein
MFSVKNYNLKDRKAYKKLIQSLVNYFQKPNIRRESSIVEITERRGDGSERVSYANSKTLYIISIKINIINIQNKQGQPINGYFISVNQDHRENYINYLIEEVHAADPINRIFPIKSQQLFISLSFFFFYRINLTFSFLNNNL